MLNRYACIFDFGNRVHIIRSKRYGKPGMLNITVSSRTRLDAIIEKYNFLKYTHDSCYPIKWEYNN